MATILKWPSQLELGVISVVQVWYILPVFWMVSLVVAALPVVLVPNIIEPTALPSCIWVLPPPEPSLLKILVE